MTARLVRALAAALAALAVAGPAAAHSGPPYPVISNQAAGAYRVSVWTDPDATDDGSAGGRFWLTIDPARAGAVPADTRAHVAIAPLDGRGPSLDAPASPVDGKTSRQYAALVMNHEGTYDVRVELSGSWGPAELRTQVQATYDLRPPLPLVGVYVLPFLLVGFLWTKRLLKRRRAGRYT